MPERCEASSRLSEQAEIPPQKHCIPHSGNLWPTPVCSRFLGHTGWDESKVAAAVAQGMMLGMLVVLTMLRMLEMMLEIMNQLLGMLERPVEMLEVMKEQQVGDS